jgi:predicted metal-dependent peptidase
MYKEVKLTPEQKTVMEIARVGFMNAAPFFCYYFYAEMKEVPTMDIQTAATDGRRIFYNPEYFAGLKPLERVFVLAHEVYHTVSRHPQRMKHYRNEGGFRSMPWSVELFNVCAGYVINADLVANNIGMCNPEWLLDPLVKPADLVEDVYEKYAEQMPPQGGEQGSASGATSGGHQNPTYGQSGGGRGGKPDKVAAGQGGVFDKVLEPETDPVTGKEDLPDQAEFQEAIARAAGAAKAMGNMPGSFQRLVDEILEPQISWREHIRMLITGKVGSRHETWDRPNRRRIVLNTRNPLDGQNTIMYLPGRRGFGANDVAVAIDTSGSIGDKELAAFRAEVGGILADVRPKRVYVIWCDATVHGVDVVSSLDEARAMSPKGGGGTDFRPPFEWLEENQVRPEAFIYLTDLIGPFPSEAPAYPVIWCATTKEEVPWGEVVRIRV